MPIRILIVCPVCRQKIDKNLFDLHIKTHDDIPAKCKIVKCNICNAYVRSDRLKKHIDRVHNKKNTDINRKKLNKNKKINKNYGIGKNNYKIFDNEISTSDDLKFGGKDYGFVARESGKFGSLPLYDDYGEDSDAD